MHFPSVYIYTPTPTLVKATQPISLSLSKELIFSL